jgi:hypothetical protein
MHHPNFSYINVKTAQVKFSSCIFKVYSSQISKDFFEQKNQDLDYLNSIEKFMIQVEPRNYLEVNRCKVEGQSDTDISCLYSLQNNLVIKNSQFSNLNRALFLNSDKNCITKIKGNFFSYNSKNNVFIEGQARDIFISYNQVDKLTLITFSSKKTTVTAYL